MLIGLNDHANIVHIVDFGLSKAFRDPKMHIHIPHTAGQGTIGSLLFASINSHLSSELSRWDNIKSLTYVLIFFPHGLLPWQHNESTSDLILASKQTTSTRELCHELPVEILTFLEYSRQLSFDERPDYDDLHRILQGLLIERGFADDFAFDWNLNTHIATNVSASLGEYFKGGPTAQRHKGSGHKVVHHTGWVAGQSQLFHGFYYLWADIFLLTVSVPNLKTMWFQVHLIQSPWLPADWSPQSWWLLLNAQLPWLFILFIFLFVTITWTWTCLYRVHQFLLTL